MNVPDYGRFDPGAPTVEALSIRDRLAEEMADAPPGSAARRSARSALVDHMLTEGLRLESFSTRGERRFAVHLSRPKPMPPEVRSWLAGRDYVRTVRALLEAGREVPFAVRLTVSEKK